MVTRFRGIVRLMQKARLGELNDKERVELQKILKDEALHKVWQQINEDQFIAERLKEYHEFSSQEAYQQFYSVVHPVKSRSIKRYLLVAAAVVVLGLGITFLWEKMLVRPKGVTMAEYGLVEPGSRKPTLRLTDGQLIEIEKDTMKIRERGGTEIQYADGAITYTTTGKVNELVYNELIVPMAGECYLVLEDGTRVWVNAGSKLKYPVKFTTNERQVFLEGEAYFDVIKNGKPFRVSTAWGDVQVLGTSFNVKAYREEDKMAATLVNGKICFAGNEKVLLEPGEQIMALKDGRWSKKKIDVEEYVSWKDGWFIFKNRRLEDMMIELERWYDVKVFYQQQSLKDIEFTGNLKRYDHVEVMLELLKLTNEINYRITGNTIIFYQ